MVLVNTSKMYKRYFIMSLIVISCNTREEHNNTTNWDKNNIRRIDVSDSNYLYAIETTQKALPVFLSAFDAKDTSLSFFIKSKFVNGQDVEHMWSKLLKHNADSVWSILDNVPNKINGIKLGDTLITPNAEIEDVIVFHGDSVLFGDFINERNN